MTPLNLFPSKLTDKINLRIESNSLRKLNQFEPTIDFYSNDYLSFARNKNLFKQSHQFLAENNHCQNGASGSRLLSGNHVIFNQLEQSLAQQHLAESALIFNSGYDANIGLISCVPQRNDVVLFDKLCHASIRDGLRLSHAKAIAFEHNNLKELEKKLIKHTKHKDSEIYVITESVFSMDGDAPDLIKLVQLSQAYQARVIIDEAHALGVFGLGLVQQYNLQNQVFARIMTFGKALGCHGAVVLGSHDLKAYLINFARSFIYTTALAPIALAHIKIAYEQLHHSQSKALNNNINLFKNMAQKLSLDQYFIESNSAIQSCVISGNQRVKSIAENLQKNNFAIKAIMAPTVPRGQERLRFCLHSHNTEDEIESVLRLLQSLI